MCQLCHDRLIGRSGTEYESTCLELPNLTYEPNPIALLRQLAAVMAHVGAGWVGTHVGNLASWLNGTDKTRESVATNRPTQPLHPIHDPALCMLGGAAKTR